MITMTGGWGAVERWRGGWVAGLAARLVVGGVVVAALPGRTVPLAAQEPERVPTIPAGVPAVFLPVQSSQPTAGGAWLGGVASERAVVDLLNAELGFALGEEEGAASWALPDKVEKRLARNPTLKVDARHLSYHGLLRKPEAHAQIYEPLHTQLRQIAALFDARIVILPMVVWYRPATPEEEAAAVKAGLENPGLGRAVLLAAVIDVRRSAVLWHGTIEGARGEPTLRAILTTLGLRTAAQLAPS